jgi:nitroreductase
MYLEAGHAAQNVFLEAQSLKLGTVTMVGFRGEDVRRALSLPEKEQPIYIMPLGRKQCSRLSRRVHIEATLKI